MFNHHILPVIFAQAKIPQNILSLLVNTGVCDGNYCLRSNDGVMHNDTSVYDGDYCLRSNDGAISVRAVR